MGNGSRGCEKKMYGEKVEEMRENEERNMGSKGKWYQRN